MTLFYELAYVLNINGNDITNLTDFSIRKSINSATELELTFENDEGALCERYHIGDLVKFQFGIGHINHINDISGVVHGIDIAGYKLKCYDWLAKLVDTRDLVKPSTFLGWEKMSAIKKLIDDIDFLRDQWEENFTTEPGGWYEEVVEWITWNASGYVDFIMPQPGSDPRYCKPITTLIDSDSFECEGDIKITNAVVGAKLLLGFMDRTGEAWLNNMKNSIGVMITPTWARANFLADDETEVYGEQITISSGTTYTYKLEYKSSKRVLYVDIYQGSTLIGSSELQVPDDESYVVSAAGIKGIYYKQSYANQMTGTLDNFKCNIRRINTKNLKGTSPHQVITTDDNLSSAWGTRMEFITKVLDEMYDLTDWHDIKLYEMWLRHDILVLKKQRDLDTDYAMMTVDEGHTTSNLMMTAPVIDKERMCNRCTVVDEENADLYYTHTDDSSVEAYGLFHKKLTYMSDGQIDTLQAVAIKYVSKHKIPTKVFTLEFYEAFMLQLGDVIEVGAAKYGIHGKYRVTDVYTTAENLPSAQITVSDRQPDISEFL